MKSNNKNENCDIFTTYLKKCYIFAIRWSKNGLNCDIKLVVRLQSNLT